MAREGGDMFDNLDRRKFTVTAKEVSKLAKRRMGKMPAAAVAPAPKSRTMSVHVEPGETQDRAVAGMLGRGLVTNASTAIRFLDAEFADLSLMDMTRELRDQGEAVNRGDFAVSERMLNAQAVALNTIFGELARRAALNMGEHLSATEAYMRLAFKAQAQCRATIETLAEMKNPPVVFARQANISNGPQQVNNGGEPQTANGAATPEQYAHTRAPGGKSSNRANRTIGD